MSAGTTGDGDVAWSWEAGFVDADLDPSWARAGLVEWIARPCLAGLRFGKWTLVANDAMLPLRRHSGRRTSLPPPQRTCDEAWEAPAALRAMTSPKTALVAIADGSLPKTPLRPIEHIVNVISQLGLDVEL